MIHGLAMVALMPLLGAGSARAYVLHRHGDHETHLHVLAVTEGAGAVHPRHDHADESGHGSPWSMVQEHAGPWLSELTSEILILVAVPPVPLRGVSTVGAAAQHVGLPGVVAAAVPGPTPASMVAGQGRRAPPNTARTHVASILRGSHALLL